MAPGGMIRPTIGRWRLAGADGLSFEAARMEAATRRHIGGVRRIATENNALAFHARVGMWHSGDQGLGVGVLWRVENGLRRPLLHDDA